MSMALLWIPAEGESNEEVKLIPRANTRTVDMEFNCQIVPIPPVTICPLA
jgi:hypothetical protein